MSLFPTTGRVGAQFQNYVTGPSADDIASAVVRKQNAEKVKAEIVRMANEALASCLTWSAWLKAKKDASIPKETLAAARAVLDYAVAAAPAARDQKETDLNDTYS